MPLVGGGTFTLGKSAPKNFSMVVFYRGLHCPVCKAYLGGLEKILTQYKERGIAVVAVSMDSDAKAAQSKSEWGLPNLALGYGIDEKTARAWGLYLSKSIREGEPGVFNEPGLFLVRPDGNVFFAAIANKYGDFRVMRYRSRKNLHLNNQWLVPAGPYEGHQSVWTNAGAGGLNEWMKIHQRG